MNKISLFTTLQFFQKGEIRQQKQHRDALGITMTGVCDNVVTFFIKKWNNVHTL